MALIHRVTRLFTADLHAVLDRIEEPEVLLRQAIREMEEELAASEQRMQSLRRESEALQRRRDGIEQSLDGVDEQLDVCFASGEESLARSLIRRRLEAERVLSALAERREATEKLIGETQTTLTENRAHLESLRQKAELLTEDARVQAPGGDEPAFNVGADEVEVVFLREKQRRASS